MRVAQTICLFIDAISQAPTRDSIAATMISRPRQHYMPANRVGSCANHFSLHRRDFTSTHPWFYRCNHSFSSAPTLYACKPMGVAQTICSLPLLGNSWQLKVAWMKIHQKLGFWRRGPQWTAAQLMILQLDHFQTTINISQGRWWLTRKIHIDR